MAEKEQEEKKPIKKYEKPTIESEDLNIYGAACNGTTKGGRKSTATMVPPPPCNPSKLNS